MLGTDRQPVKVNADGTVDVAKVGNFALTGVKKAGDSYFTGTAAGERHRARSSPASSRAPASTPDARWST